MDEGELIIYINGTLSEEWESKRQSCNIYIYSNSIEIDLLSADSKEKSIKYGFKSINQLKIDSNVEEKKKFLFPSKVFYLKLSIDYSSDNQGIKTIPSIIINESNYNEIIKSINKYIAKIKEKEEKEKREREQRIKAESFKTEFIKAMGILSHIYKDICLDSYEIRQRYFFKIKINDKDLFYYIVKDMYEKIGETKSIDQATRVLKDPHYVESLMYRVIDWPGDLVSSSKFFALIARNIDIWLGNNIPDNYLYNRLMFDDREKEIKDILDLLLGYIDIDNDDGWKVLCCFAVIFMFAYSFIKALIFYRNISKFIENTELFLMYKNLADNTNLNIDDISAKLYPIYRNYYAETFEREYIQLEFYSFMIIFNLYYNEKNKKAIELYEEEIKQFKNSLTKDAYDFSVNEYDLLLRKVQELLLNIDNKKYFESIGVPYDLNYKYIDGVYAELYEYILKRIGNSLPSDVFFKLFYDKRFEGVYTFLKKKQEDEIIKKERERLLKGDLSKEKELEYDKYSFDNITNGYEFEKYLKTIFERMGYDVEVTNKSNDQGGDLIIEKDGERTVVQAKFYSNPVGNKAVQEVVAAKSYYKAEKGMIVTNSTFTNSAVALAEVNNIILIDGNELNRIRDAILETI